MGSQLSARLVLASASPRRRQILEQLEFDFRVRPVDVDESPRADEAPHAYVERLARTKALTDARPGELILAADTIVVLDGELFGKPNGATQARSMLARLGGETHTVLTGLALFSLSQERLLSEVESAEVTLSPLRDEEIEWYVGTAEPLDKAGAYAIQGLGALFVERLVGNFTNVVGLPLPLLRRMFGELGRSVNEFRANGRGDVGDATLHSDASP